ncbi:hypothetical protein IANJMKHF_00012 [Klebsiella phage CPRSA]|nr:hypothetical protein IANJMKHF_00012 [Klebsiella phage CPRSA]UQJ95404.1 hypothetical protein ALHIDCOG_00016 [Klebsiella phage CPRSB]
MTYEDMLNEVCAGKTAYRTTNPDMIVFREGIQSSDVHTASVK